MFNDLLTLIVDEGKWLPFSMSLGISAVVALLLRSRRSAMSTRRLIYCAMTLFFGVMIGSMALGHLLAVTTKLALGTLEGSIAKFYAIGAVLAVPSWWLVYGTVALFARVDRPEKTTAVLNAWLAATLLLLGVHNLPLAAPGLLNVGYHLHSRRVVGWVLAGLAVVVSAGLFIGSLIFMASGQSFEQFRGMDQPR